MRKTSSVRAFCRGDTMRKMTDPLAMGRGLTIGMLVSSMFWLTALNIALAM